MWRLFIFVLSLTFCTTLLTIQQTHKYKIRYNTLQPPHHPIYLGQNRIVLNRVEQHGGRLRPGQRKQNVKNKPHSAASEQRKFHSKRRKTTGGKEKFLLPVLFYNMGPNNLFRIFKEAIPIAKALNRTIVVPPFHHHPRMKLDAEEAINGKTGVIDIQIFDETFKSVVEKNAEQVMDVNLLRRYVQVQPLKSFLAQCGRYIDVLVKCGDVSGKRDTGLRHFTSFNDITVISNLSVDSLRDVTENRELKINLKSVERKSHEEPCVGLAIGSKCLGSRPAWFEHWQSVSRYVRRPVDVRMLVNRFLSKILRSKSYLAVHWRYEATDWMDMCKESRPESVRNINNPMCDLAGKFATNSSFLQNMLTRLNDFAIKKKLSAMYISTPPQLTSALRKMKRTWSNLYTVSDVEEFAHDSRAEFETNIFASNFAASFLEQEICFRGSFFLGSPLSSWTQTVLLDRVASNIHEHGSVLDVISEGDDSLFPKLVWYFPEGD